MSVYATGQFQAGFGGVDDLAFGPHGILYIDDINGVFDVPAGGGTSQLIQNVLVGFGAIAVDSGGNVYTTQGVTNEGEIINSYPGASSSVFASIPGASNEILPGLAFDSSGNLYASSYKNGEIFEISPSGVVTPFASGLSDPTFMAYSPTLVPEPASATLFATASLLVLARRPRKNFLATDGKSDSHR